MNLNSRGMSLSGLMAAIAAGAVLLAVVGAIYERMAATRVQTEIYSEVESLMNYLQNGVRNPAVCGDAFKSGTSIGGARITWNPNTPRTFGHIEFGNTMGAFAGQTLIGTDADQKLAVDTLTIREPAGGAEGSPVRSIVRVNGVDFRIVAAKIEVAFIVPNRIFPQGLSPRTIDVTVGFPAAGGPISMCYQSQTYTPKPIDCGPGIVDGGRGCGLTSPGCQRFYYVYRFDVDGTPHCACDIICKAAPTGPAGYYVPPPMPPGKGGGN